MKRLQIRFPEKDFFVSVFSDDVYVVGGTVRDRVLYKTARRPARTSTCWSPA